MEVSFNRFFRSSQKTKNIKNLVIPTSFQ